MTSLVAFGLVVLAAGVLGVPLARAWFAKLPARGAGLSFAVGLLALLWLAWLPPATGAVALTTASAIGAALLLAGAAGALLVRDRRQERPRERAEVVVARAAFAIFVVAYLAWATLRALSPGYGSGEQPMDHGFVAAILRSRSLPPVDPWLAGERLDNYYYGTHFLVATLTRLSGVGVSTAFNLAQSAFYAVCATTVFGLTAELALLARARLRVAVGAGVVAASMAMVAGNPAGGLQILLDPVRLLDYDWWAPSRVVDYAINEFPFFAFLYGELHAHMLSVPTLLLVVAAVAQLAVAGPGRGRRLVVGAGCLGLAAGALGFLNAWDQPTAAAVAIAGALVWLAGGPRGHRLARARRLIAFGAVAIAVAALAWLPFQLDFHGPPVGIRIVQPERTILDVARDYGLVFGLLAWIAVAYTSHALVALHGARRAAIAGAALALAVAALALLGLGGLALFVFAVLPPAVVACGRGLPAVERLCFALLAAAFALALVGEVVVVREAFSEGPFYRQNTVFKFGYHAWFLLAIVCAALAARPGSGRELMRWPWQAGLGALAGLCIVYPVAGSIARTQGFRHGPQLDLLAGLQERSPGDAAAVRWLRRHVTGTPTLVEATGDDYTAAGRMASLTGIPAVADWPGHELQWGKLDGFERRGLVDEMYTTLDRVKAGAILRRFDVRFVVVGSLERERYASAGLAKFDRMAHRAFAREGTVVYDVRRRDHGGQRTGAQAMGRGPARATSER